MSFRSFDRNWCRALAAIGLGALAVSNAPGAGPPPPGRRIEFSQPTNANDVVWTNLSRFKPITDALPQFEERGQGTSDLLGLGSSMEGLPAPPPQYVVIPSRRLQQRLDRQKNWASMTPEEVLLDDSGSASLSTSAFEDSSKPPGGQEKDKHSRRDSSSTGRQPGTFSPDSSGDSGRSSASRKRQGQSDSRDEADLPDDIKATERQLRDLQKMLRSDMDSDPFSTVSRASTGFSDFFGSDSQKSGWLDQVAHNKAVMEQFKQAIESPLSPSFSSSLNLNPFESIVGLTPGIDTLKSTPPVRSPFSQTDGLDSRSNALLPPPPGVSGDALTGQSSALSAQPKLFQAPQQPTLTPPTPTFVFPKRVFQ
ncbi:MAG: hypothetical protein ABSH34_22105 [Verrucomicrobiota bacterium]|jgi:hypothetical protein